MSTELVDAAVMVLRHADVELEAGLSRSELGVVQSHFGFLFAPDHASLLTECLPVGESWPDWRHGNDEELQRGLDWPVNGALFDVSENGFWLRSWGEKPQDPGEASRTAKFYVRRWPLMVPVYGHRYIASGPEGRAVFSIYQTDVIYYGSDLADYFHREFGSRGQDRDFVDECPIWPWSNLSAGADDCDL